MKWYKHDPDAWLVGVMGLSIAERGVYQTVLCMIYSRDGILPDDDHLISRTLGVNPRTWRTHKAALIEKGKIRVTAEGTITANRVDETLKEAREYSERQSNAARMGAEQRKNNNENNAPSQPSTTTTTAIRKKDAACAAPELPLADRPPAPKLRIVEDSLDNPEKALFDRGKQVLGENAAGLIVKIRNSQGGNIALARAMIERASTKQNPREWVSRAIIGPANEVDAREEARLIEAWKTKHRKAVVFDTDRPGAIAEMLADRARAAQ